MNRILQYIQRWANIYLTSLPGHYEKEKIEKLTFLFVTINELLKGTGEEYWLDFGTLLGYHREQGIISHDIDIDFGMHEKSYQKMLTLSEKLPSGFRLFDTSKRHRGPKIYFSYQGFDVDVYFYQDLGDHLRSYEKSRFANETSEVPKELIYPVKEVVHLGQKTFVPARTKAYLEHIYGYIGRNAIRDKATGYYREG